MARKRMLDPGSWVDERSNLMGKEGRMLDPEIWTDERTAKLTRRQLLLYIGLVSLEDDEGRVNASPRYLKYRIFPEDKDVSPGDIQSDLDKINEVGLVLRWQDDTTGNLYMAPLL